MTRELINEGWSYRTKASAFSELGGASGAGWADVTLPHDALIGTPRDPKSSETSRTGFYDGGVFEYRKIIAVAPERAGERMLLEFDGVYRDAMVYVNGTLAGQRAYGYSRFTVRIDPFLRFGEDNEIRVECRAHHDARWYSGAGIYRDVHLISKAPAHLAVDGVRVTTVDVDDTLATVEVTAEIENGDLVTRTLSLRAGASDESGVVPERWAHSPVTLLPGERSTVRLRLYVAEPRLWSVESPELYSVAIELLADDVILDREEVRTGIRTLRVDPHRGLRINGDMVKLRGACVHHDNGPLGAATIDQAEERRIRLLKEAGFNAVRSAHNPMSSAMLDACDRLGMLVMDEAFDMWTSSKVDHDYSSAFTEWWERDIEAMVAKDVNHPSVIMYSIGNEIPEVGTSFGANLGRRLAEKVRELDGTRFVTNGINGFVSILDDVVAGMKAQSGEESAGGGVNTMMVQLGSMMRQISASDAVTTRTEESFAVLDIAGMNYGDGRYELDRELFPDRIIVGTETFPTQIAENWALVEAHPQLLGDFTWTGWDYLGESGIGGTDYAAEGEEETAGNVAHGYPWLAAWCGDIDLIGERRTVSYYRETVFGLRSQPYIAVHRPENHGRQVVFETPWSWSDTLGSWSWPGHEGRPISVEVYSDAEEIELLLDGAVVGRSSVGTRRAFMADFDLTYQPGRLTARALSNGSVTGEAELVSAAPDRVITLTADRSDIQASTTDAAFVGIAITDAAGVVHTDDRRDFEVAVDGPGVLQGLGSGDPRAVDGFTGGRCSSFDGRLLAAVRPTGAGTITVTVSAEGLTPATTTLFAETIPPAQTDGTPASAGSFEPAAI
jgi:beta-galactosidase